jgi:polar amino acid transport system permease protein
MFDFSVVEFGILIILKGAVATVIYCTIATGVGLVLGTFIALGRLSKTRILRALSAVFIEPFRNTPFLVQAFLIYFGLAQLGFRLSAPIAGALILSLYGTALFAEAVRGGILSVPKGQLEAARAVGMPYLIGMKRVVFPQMIGYMIPVITNLTIGLIKDSAALSIITVPELSMAAQIVVGETFRPVETYIIVATVYWLLTTAVASSFVAFHQYALHRRGRLARAWSMNIAAPPDGSQN